MGNFVIKPLIKYPCWLITSILVYLNIRMVTEQAGDYFATSDNIFWKIVIIAGRNMFISLLMVSIVYPLMGKKRRDTMHNCIRKQRLATVSVHRFIIRSLWPWNSVRRMKNYCLMRSARPIKTLPLS